MLRRFFTNKIKPEDINKLCDACETLETLKRSSQQNKIIRFELRSMNKNDKVDKYFMEPTISVIEGKRYE